MSPGDLVVPTMSFVLTFVYMTPDGPSTDVIAKITNDDGPLIVLQSNDETADTTAVTKVFVPTLNVVGWVVTSLISIVSDT